MKNQETTKKFLESFPGHVYQVFDDNEKRKDTSLAFCATPENWNFEQLEQAEAQGCGLFFSVNGFPTGRRLKVECGWINAWFAESDELPLKEQEKNISKSPLEPSFVVKAKKSYHMYWLAQNGTKANFEKIQLGLAKHFTGDTAMKDIARVLRIPGSRHQKDPENPVDVELVMFNPDLKYSEAEIMAAFPYQEKVSIELTPTGGFAKELFNEASRLVKVEDDFWVSLKNLDNKMILEMLSGSSLVDSQTFTFRKRTSGGVYIDVNGNAADCWIDAQGFIGSGKGAGPTWIQWLGFYGATKSQIADWAKQNFPELVPEKPKSFSPQPIVRQSNSLRDRLIARYNEEKSPYTWGFKLLDKGMPIIERGSFVVIFGQQGSGKTLFAFWSARQNSTYVRTTFLSLEMTQEQIVHRYILQRAGIGKEDWEERNADPAVIDKFLPEVEKIDFVGIDEGKSYGLKEIEEIILEHKPEILYIDNLNKISGKKGSEIEITQDTTAGLLKLSRAYNIPIILIHHANKQQENKKKKKDNYNFRGMSGVRGSNKTNDDADIIVEIARPEPDINSLNPNMTYIRVYKDRDFDYKRTHALSYENGDFSCEDLEVHNLIAKSFGVDG